MLDIEVCFSGRYRAFNTCLKLSQQRNPAIQSAQVDEEFLEPNMYHKIVDMHTYIMVLTAHF